MLSEKSKTYFTFQKITLSRMYQYVSLCAVMYPFVLAPFRFARPSPHAKPYNFNRTSKHTHNSNGLHRYKTLSKKHSRILRFRKNQQYSALLNFFTFLRFVLIDLRSVQHNKILTEYKNVHPITSDYTSRKYQRKNTGTFAS